MDHKDDGAKSSRRNFLKLAAVTAPAAVAATALTGTAANADAMLQQDGTSGLQDTAHTRAYLESAKF